MSESEGGWTITGGWLDEAANFTDALDKITLPEVSVKRGGIKFHQPGSPEWERMTAAGIYADTIAKYVDRAIGNLVAAQKWALDQALFDADRLHMGVRVVRPRPGWPQAVQMQFDGDTVSMPGPYRFIGIEVTHEVPVGRIETIVHHDPWGDDR